MLIWLINNRILIYNLHQFVEQQSKHNLSVKPLTHSIGAIRDWT